MKILEAQRSDRATLVFAAVRTNATLGQEAGETLRPVITVCGALKMNLNFISRIQVGPKEDLPAAELKCQMLPPILNNILADASLPSPHLAGRKQKMRREGEERLGLEHQTL